MTFISGNEPFKIKMYTIERNLSVRWSWKKSMQTAVNKLSLVFRLKDLT